MTLASHCLNDISPMDIMTMLINDPHDDDPDVNDTTMSNAVTLLSSNTSSSHHGHGILHKQLRQFNEYPHLIAI